MRNIAAEALVDLCAVDVVLASFESVRVHSLTNDAIADPPVPCSGGVTATATGATVITTRHEVLGQGKKCNELSVMNEEREVKVEEKGNGGSSDGEMEIG